MATGHRRSWLSVPGSRTELIAKAAGAGADGIIVDLEDSVAPNEKDAARAGLIAAIATVPDAEISVRVNAPGSPWSHLDLIECARLGGPSTVMIPKVECAGDIEFVDRLLTGAEAAAGRREPTAIAAIIESATGLVSVREIARSSKRLNALVIGYADMAASIGRDAATAPEQWLFVQETVLSAARSAGLAAIDGPYLGVEVDADFTASVEHASRLGFDSKWVIHPRQAQFATAAFTPGIADADYARAVLDTLRQSHGDGIGAVTLNGKMIDEAVAVWARRILARTGGD